MKKHLLTQIFKSVGFLFLTCAAILSTSLESATVDGIDETIPAHQFFIKTGKVSLPVVGVQSENRILIEQPDKSLKVYSPDPHDLRVVEKQMLPVGRITICSTWAQSERANRLEAIVESEISGGDFTFEMGETIFDFEVVADRDLPGCYVALFINNPARPDVDIVDFGNIGDLKAGELVEREIVFPNTTVSEGMAYRFEFYSKGEPIDMYSLENLVMNPASKVLMIPWQRRLECYLAINKRVNESPRPWKMPIKNLDLETYRSRNASDLKLTLRVHADGSVDLVDGDPRLDDQELVNLRKDMNQWLFFPALRKGKPQSNLVAVPLKI